MKGQALPPRLRIGKPEPLACLPRWMLCDLAHSYERWPCSVGDRDRQRRRRRLCAGAGPAGRLLVRACYSAFDHTALELLLTELASFEDRVASDEPRREAFVVRRTAPAEYVRLSEAPVPAEAAFVAQSGLSAVPEILACLQAISRLNGPSSHRDVWATRREIASRQTTKNPICRHFYRRERRDSNPRPPA